MSVDPYAPCPCGSGKKLKFCCTDLTADIEKITRLVGSDQPHAALQHVDHLLAKQPDRASLLDIRAMLELSLHDFDAAEKTLAHFQAVDPDNPAMHAQAAVLEISRDHPEEGLWKLQDALERTGDSMPQRVFEAIGAVGHALLLDGDVVAARAHLLLYAGLAPPGDNRALELLLRLNLQAGLPLMLRDPLLLREAPADFAAKPAFDEANRLARRGLWRRAAAEYSKLFDADRTEPAVVYNLAVVRGWLGDTELLADGLHVFARLPVPLADAVEAEALAQLIDPLLDEPQRPSVRVAFPLLDEDAAAERLLSNKCIERYEMDPETLDEQEVARPRSTLLLLDRPIPSTGVDLAMEDAPNILAFLSIYGKRTDREARLEAITDLGETLDRTASLLREILGDAIGAAGEPEVVAERSASEEALGWRWRLPDDTPPAHRRALLGQRRRRAILEDWPVAPRAALDNLSPRDAAGRDDLRVPLLASVLIIEQAAADPGERELFQELREQLNLPRTEIIDAASVDLDRLPITRMASLDLKNAPLDGLMALFNRAAMSGAGVATLAAANEIVSRDDAAGDLAPVYRHLVRSEPDPDRALAWTARAKQWAARAKQPGGEWTLLELEVQIERGDPLGVQAALDDLRANHLGEPGVAEATYRLLYTAGLLTPREAPPGAAAPASAASGLWTPGQEAPAPTGGKSAIWTP